MYAVMSTACWLKGLFDFDFIFLIGVFTGFGLRDGAALFRRRGRNTQNLGDTILNLTCFADIPRYAECAERRANAPARPCRATA